MNWLKRIWCKLFGKKVYYKNKLSSLGWDISTTECPHGGAFSRKDMKMFDNNVSKVGSENCYFCHYNKDITRHYVRCRRVG